VPEQIDESIIQKATKGDSEAFSVLYQAYVTRIYNYIFYRTGNTFDAEDLTARVFHRAMHSIGKYEHRGLPFSAWLYRIAHNLVANWHRDNSRRKEIRLEDHITHEEHSPHLESSLIHHQEGDMLMQAIRQLPAERQQLIILKYVEHLTNAEIAVIMRKSEGAIKSLYHRTLESLRETISIIESKQRE